ncbi:MAG TPA: hypothetical protein VH598_11435, partial [Verrucomicrobiae bacterium]|nr:hypothetical protein [Verrucomicrobiae bacterium]
ASDMFFAEIRPFDEIYREGQSPDGSPNGGGQQANQTQKLSELQKQITSATWNLKRRESAPSPSPQYKNDATVIHDSQQQALEQARALEEKIDDPRLKGFATEAASQMDQAARHLGEAVEKNSVAPFAQALADEQSAAQSLLRLQAREYQVARNSRNQRGGGGGGQNQRQLDELDLKQTDNRYETQRQATPAQTPEQREQLQVASRLKELAQRQQDLNSRLKELQTALQEAKTDQEREDVRQRLKRLREEQQDLLADVDELRQRMERPENQSRMAEARQQLEQTRSEVQRAAEELKQEAVPQALASGTRAQRELQKLQEDFRRKNSSQFADDMRQMRDNARQLAQNEEDIAKKLQDVAEPKQKTLNDDSTERRDLAEKMTQQKDALTNLFTQMRQVSEQSETAEPLLSKQLYDTLRQTDQDSLNKSLDASSQLVRRGFVPQAGQFEQLAHQNIDELKRNVERAAESVLGDGTEALRLAKRELEDLSKQLNQEASQAGGPQGTNAAAGGTNVSERGAAEQAQSSGVNTNEGPAQASAGQRGSGQESSQPQSGQQANAGGDQQSSKGQGESSQGGQQQSASSGQNPQDSQNQSGRSGQGQGGQQQSASANSPSGGGGGGGANRAGGGRRNFLDDNGGFNNGGGGGGTWGPLIGEDYVNWSDRLRNVEEMIDVPDLSAEVARIR